MHSIQRSFLLSIACLLFAPWAQAGLDEAKANYAKIFVVPPGAKFENSPFKHTYLLNGGNTYTLFDQDLMLSGYQQNWQMRPDGRSGWTSVNFNQAEGLKSVLRQNLKTDWMVKAAYGTGGKTIVVISAPNCPVCKQMEADMARHGKSIPASIFIVPTLLGRGAESYRNAILCSADPQAGWLRSLQSGPYPASSSVCEKSRWAEIVIDNAFPVVNGQFRISTPTMLLSDGSTVQGWKGGSSVAEIKRKLGL